MRLSPTPLRLACALSLAFLALPATAARLEIQGGRSYMDSYTAKTVFVEAVFDERRLGDSRLSWAPDASLGWIDGRDTSRFGEGRYSARDPVWLAALGARFRYGDPGDWYRSLFFSFQPALQHGRTQALSSVYEFVSTLGWQGQHVSVQIRHVSNGSLQGPNRGETMALLGVGFDI